MRLPRPLGGEQSAAFTFRGFFLRANRQARMLPPLTVLKKVLVVRVDGTCHTFSASIAARVGWVWVGRRWP